MSVCVLSTRVSCAKTDEPTEMPFGVSHIGQSNRILDGIHIPIGRGNFGGCPVRWKTFGISAAVYAAKGIIKSSKATWERDCCSWLQCSQLIDVIYKHTSSWLDMMWTVSDITAISFCLYHNRTSTYVHNIFKVQSVLMFSAVFYTIRPSEKEYKKWHVNELLLNADNRKRIWTFASEHHRHAQLKKTKKHLSWRHCRQKVRICSTKYDDLEMYYQNMNM